MCGYCKFSSVLRYDNCLLGLYLIGDKVFILCGNIIQEIDFIHSM